MTVLRPGIAALALFGLLILVACGGGATGGGNNNGGGGGSPTPSVSSVAVSPAHAEMAAAGTTAATQQFTATVTVAGGAATTVSWTVNGVAGGNAALGTITATGLYTPPPNFLNPTMVAATSTADTSKKATALVTVTDLAGVTTFHNNGARDGSNTQEYALTVADVNTTKFGKLFSCPVDGATYTQPLWVPNLNIGGKVRNVILVATQHDSAYAFDADAKPCAQLWKVNLVDAAHGAGAFAETSVPNPLVGNNSGDVQPEIGVTGTPVIDAATKTMYLVSKSIDSGNSFHIRLHALNLIDGSERFSGPVNVGTSVTGNGAGSTGGIVPFDLRMEHQRSGLALANGVVYVSWAAHEDADPYHGWLIGYNANTLAQASKFNATPNGTRGGIWMGGGAPAVDANNNLYVLTGNGTFDNTNDNYGDSALRLNPSLGLTDWFTPYNQADLENRDLDLASSGLLLLPDQTSGPAHLLLAAGKEGRVYLIDRDSMGHYCSACTTTDTNVIQSFFITNNFGTPAFWNNSLYFGGADFGSGGDFVKQFVFTGGTFATSAATKSATRFPFPGTMPSVSSGGSNNGIVWAIDASQYGPPSSRGTGPAVLHAYDATNLVTELWNSSQATGGRDQAGYAVKFTAPTIANGKVYLNTRTEVDVYGLF
jgi:hypothetical protein